MVDFIHEVEEELRKDQYNALLRKWGPALVVLCVLIVAAAGAYEYFKSADTRIADATSISYVQATELAAAGNDAAASSQFLAIADKARPGYAGLSLMQAANLALEANNSGQAIALYDRAANTFELPLHSHLAQLKAAYLVMDNGNYDDVNSRLEPLLADDAPFKDLARELKGMAALEQGDVQTANAQFALLARSVSVTEGIQSRADQVLAITADSAQPNSTVDESPIVDGADVEVLAPELSTPDDVSNPLPSENTQEDSE